MIVFDATYWKKNRVWWHIIGWLVYTPFVATAWGGPFIEGLIYESVLMPAKIVIVYFNLYVLLPRLLLKKKYLAYALAVCTCLFLGAIWQRIMVIYVYIPMRGGAVNAPFFYFPIMLRIAMIINSILILTSAAYILMKGYQYQQMIKELEKEKLSAELKFLKSQVQPHFLFNTLNNLYGLTLRQSPKAPEIVLKLSELMRYMLYKTNASRVPLSQEINYLKNYITLEKIRYDDAVNVFFQVHGDILDKEIAPMLLIAFIENSFKHGVSEGLEDAWVKITIKLEEHRLFLDIANSMTSPKQVMPVSQEEVATLAGESSGGVGLPNVQHRLELLYKDRYTLDVQQSQESFHIKLALELD
ncbi:hypothetical protein BKI52_08380 [marine bacterium AO1-C]|nr:hypothetical protein BKI52_08380 [marine bacterium AO1-C]